MNKRRNMTLLLGWVALVVILAAFGCSKQPAGSGGEGAATATASPQAAPGTEGGTVPAAPAGPGEPGGLPPADSAAVAPPPPRTYTLEAGTPLEIRLSDSLSTKENASGQGFGGQLVKPLADGDWVIADKGAAVEGTVVESNPGGRVKGVAFLVLTLKRLTLANGQKISLQTNNFTQEARKTHGKDAAKIAGGAGVGAVIGGIAGGGKGAAIGAVVGGGAGTGVVLATRGDPARIGAGTRLTFRLKEAVTVTE